MIREKPVSAQSPHTYRFEDWNYWSDSGRQYMPLPRWATYFMGVGQVIAQLPSEAQPSLIAVSTPTLGYSGTLAATGFMLSSDVTAMPLEHIESLRGLEIGRQVWVTKEKTRIKGSFDGIVPIDTSEGIRVIFKRRKTVWVETYPLRSAMQVQVATNNTPSKQSNFIQKSPMSDFASLALGAMGRECFPTRLSIEAIIVGQKNRLREEIINTIFAVERNGKYAPGKLQDILRTIEFGDAQDAHGFASDVEVPNQSCPQYFGVPHLVVFDGARAFALGRKRHMEAHHWLVLLDRTNRNFADSCDAVDGMFLERAGALDHELLAHPPIGIETTSFVRGR